MARTNRHHITLLAGLAAALVALPATPGVAQTPAPATNGTITNLAGTVAGFAGDGGPAVKAQLDMPQDIAVAAPGTYLIADLDNDRIRQITPNGIINTIAGDGDEGFGGDGGPATQAELDNPRGVTALPAGGYLIADTANNRIRMVAPSGIITTVAGSNSAGFGGDGGPATAARLNQPSATAVLPGGGFLIADTANSRIRKVAPNGIITTIAGGIPGFSGDGGPAANAQINQPRDVAVGADGTILIADTANNRVRAITPAGTIFTAAGSGIAPGLSGDGDPARTAALNGPQSVAALPHGGFLVADSSNARVRRVTPLGAIFTVAGTAPGSAGNGGLANAAKLSDPSALAVDPSGGFLVADTANASVRRVSDVGAIPPAVPNHSFDVSPVGNGVMVQPAGGFGAAPLLEQDLVPIGSQVNAVVGKIAVTTALNPAGTQQTAQLYDGAFTVSQLSDPARGLETQFRLPSVTDCTTAKRRSVRVHTAKKKAKSKAKSKAKPKPKSKSKTAHGLWVTDTGGNWRTATGTVAAAAIGTQWHTTLTCSGTRIGVHQGAISVRDRVHQRTVILRAGQSQLFPSSAATQGK